MKFKSSVSVGSVLALAAAGIVVASSPSYAASCDVSQKIVIDCDYTVPSGVTSISVEAAGGNGGDAGSSTGGNGAVVGGRLAVTPGDTLSIQIGGAGGNTSSTAGGTAGTNGGGSGGAGNCYTRGGGAGGGGSTTIWSPASSPLVVAAGGSGATVGREGTAAGQHSNGDGSHGLPAEASTTFGGGGGPGSDSAGGAAGLKAPNSSTGSNGTVGTSGQGGTGGSDSTNEACAGSGGGGGYFGGGGGGSSVARWAGGTGGSGSSYLDIGSVSQRSIESNAEQEAGWVTVNDAPAPTLTAVEPPSGPAVGGTRVKVIGTNLQLTGVILFGDRHCTNLVERTSTSIICASAPSHAAGIVNVSVDGPGGPATLVGAYTYKAAVPVNPKAPGRPAKLKVKGGINASKYLVSWNKSARATAATKYTLRVFKPRSKKSVIITRTTKSLRITLTRNQIRRAWVRSRGEQRVIVNFRVTVTAKTGSKNSSPAVASIRMKV